MTDRYEIATWRFEQIAPWFDCSLNKADRRAALRQRTTRAVEWPQIKADKKPSRRKRKPIPRSTLSRWIRLYRNGGYLALMPKVRSDKGHSRLPQSRQWVDHAIALLYENPSRSLSQLQLYLEIRFEAYNMSRSTLQRHLKSHPAYKGIEQLRGKRSKKTRDRYQASCPHECWQLDGKGPFSVRLKSGERIRVHILSIIDDFSRFVLAAVVATSEDTVAAIRTFTRAATLFGLPDRMQFDQGSAFDSELFRHGLAQCGIHRNKVKRRNPEAQGKIEAYHKVLGRWFIEELPLQEVVDTEHLQTLLDATIALMVNRRDHRALKTSPEKRLAGRTSDRRISENDLARAFYREVSAKTDKKTGHVRLDNGTYRVPGAFAGLTARFLFDPVRPGKAFLLTQGGQEIELSIASIKPLPAPRVAQLRQHGQGPLQVLLDLWRGTPRKNAEPGFGLPEVFSELGTLLNRATPESETEAIAVLAFWRRLGPLARDPFKRACAQAQKALGQGRPLRVYLDDIERQITKSRNDSKTKEDPS
jgi:transposase InsO family protein